MAVLWWVLAVLMSLSAPAAARELADAPEIRIIGTSPDGRYFAYEQFMNDTVSMQVLAAVDVIDRDKGGSAPGFPMGFLPLSKNGEYPAKVGEHDIKIDEKLPEAEQLATLRRHLRELTRDRLAALGIADNYRRLAGRVPTDRSTRSGPVAFTIGATLPGPVPDMQPVYEVSTRIAPDDHRACVAGGAPRDHQIEILLKERSAGKGAKGGSSRASLSWPHGDNDCAQSATVTDVVVPSRSGDDGPKHVVVVVLAASWGLHAETARYLATFVELPK